MATWPPMATSAAYRHQTMPKRTQKSPHSVNHAGLPVNQFMVLVNLFFALHPAGQAAKKKWL